MTETQQQIQNPTGSIRSPEKIEDLRMKVNEDNMEQSSPYPDRPGERDCQFFLRTGQCGYGNTCRYNHPLTHLPQGVIYYKDQLPERIGQPDCEYFLKTGACKYGPTCKYHHPKDRNGAGPVLFNVLGYPMREGEKACPYYMRTGFCRFGVACKFHHPHPQPPNGHSAYAMSSFPSVGFPYASGMTMMSLPLATYGAMPCSQVPQSQAYMPFMVAPSQGLLSPQGWATYMPNSSSSASVPVAVTSHHHSFSERAECRFLVNTGTCKYGDNCKYSHPKERLLQTPPARPGQPACGNFKAYGFCKFGASCKFDHSAPESQSSETEKQDDSPTQPEKPEVHGSLPPSQSESTTLSNGKPAPESQSSETGKQDDSPTQPEKSEVHDSLPPSHSDSTALSNGKPAPESRSSETEKQDNSPTQPEKSEVHDSLPPSHSDSTALSSGKLAPESQSSETEKQDDSPTQREKSEVHDSLPPSHSASTTLPNGKPDAENPGSESEKQCHNPAQPDCSKVQDSSDKST